MSAHPPSPPDVPKPILPCHGGYSMPAEWELHEATWLAWPRNPQAWHHKLKAAQQNWLEIARELSSVEKVCLLVHDPETEKEVAQKLRVAGADMDRVLFYRVSTVDIWIRDYGPTFVTKDTGDRKVAANSWVFNAWGGKYEAWLRDDGVASQVARLLKVPLYESHLVLEGGSIEVNGHGTCLTTEQCLLNPNRNPGLSRRDIEQMLRDHLSVEHFIWLGNGLSGDDTDGHIDNLARFVSRTTVVCAVEEDPKDPNYVPSQENYEKLQGATDERGANLNVVTLPLPGPVMDNGVRLPASYANFYIANEAVLVPTYAHPNDEAALGILRTLFPKRRVVGIPCSDLVYGLGAIHCMTQQEPAASTE